MEREICTVRRGFVYSIDGEYFHEALQAWHGMLVLVSSTVDAAMVDVSDYSTNVYICTAELDNFETPQK